MEFDEDGYGSDDDDDGDDGDDDEGADDENGEGEGGEDNHGEDEGGKDEGEEDEGEEGKGGEGEGGEDEGETNGEENEEQGVQVLNIGNGEAKIHMFPFLEFPLLKHHAHPFFVIARALAALEENYMHLDRKATNLYRLMSKIRQRWQQDTPAARLRGRRKRPRPYDDDDDDGGGNGHPSKRKAPPRASLPSAQLTGAAPAKARRARGNVDRAKGKERQRKRDASVSEPPKRSQLVTPSATSHLSTTETSGGRKFLFDDKLEVSAWADAVAAAGPAEEVEIDITSDDEEARPPIQNWKRWRHPYKQPKKYSRFCSSDWSMYLYSIPLWT
jgi:hypothetical protein